MSNGSKRQDWPLCPIAGFRRLSLESYMVVEVLLIVKRIKKMIGGEDSHVYCMARNKKPIHVE